MTDPVRLVSTVVALSAIMACVSTGSSERDHMVDTQIRARGVADERVLAAMRRVERHRFVPQEHQARAYDDTPLPIGFDQTISQPYIVAYMSEVLDTRSTDRVLEIGTGSGYQAAILGELVRDVYTIEIVEPLAIRAQETITALGYTNVHVRHGNGYLGWPEAAPFDRIIVTAAPDEVPGTLTDQLSAGGVMVVPVGRGEQMMKIVRKTERGLATTETLPVRFVPMVGKERP